MPRAYAFSCSLVLLVLAQIVECTPHRPLIITLNNTVTSTVIAASPFLFAITLSISICLNWGKPRLLGLGIAVMDYLVPGVVRDVFMKQVMVEEQHEVECCFELAPGEYKVHRVTRYTGGTITRDPYFHLEIKPNGACFMETLSAYAARVRQAKIDQSGSKS